MNRGDWLLGSDCPRRACNKCHHSQYKKCPIFHLSGHSKKLRRQIIPAQSAHAPLRREDSNKRPKSPKVITCTRKENGGQAKTKQCCSQAHLPLSAKQLYKLYTFYGHQTSIFCSTRHIARQSCPQPIPIFNLSGSSCKSCRNQLSLRNNVSYLCTEYFRAVACAGNTKGISI